MHLEILHQTEARQTNAINSTDEGMPQGVTEIYLTHHQQNEEQLPLVVLPIPSVKFAQPSEYSSNGDTNASSGGRMGG